ncbi:DUF4259 domain-containing protein [Dactylosporangium siamense]|uniref:DUF4259 domain-containing protein n=1 Tax=Dactylosporangium siamense TaxID=685454 RepID=A0A919PPX0_9ACTN|nr:DUF4259 domain-containing protein [Dactylosporangium siamense]GIG48067.1 hypothetical protein Dsi01nite_061080 [Dactylosporangium siamense]
MATWGPEPFASDAGQDLLDRLAGSTDDERLAVLREILGGVSRIGERGFDWFEQDVVDAAALVALSVPGGMEQLADIGHGAEAAVVIGGVDIGLRTQALVGLELMLQPGNDWHDTWIDGDEDCEGARTAHAIAAVLRSSSVLPG